MPYESFQLVRSGDQYFLGLPDSTEVPLDAGALFKLAEIGLECRNLHGLDRPPVGPVLVAVDLDYSDFDSDQTTSSYSVRMLVPREVADETQIRLSEELFRTSRFSHTMAYIKPHAFEDCDHPDKRDSVAEAVGWLRYCLLGHQSDSVACDVSYWQACGFTVLEADDLANLDLYDKTNYGYDYDIEELLEKVAADFSEDEAEERDSLVGKLRRWFNGEDFVPVETAQAVS